MIDQTIEAAIAATFRAMVIDHARRDARSRDLAENSTMATFRAVVSAGFTPRVAAGVNAARLLREAV